jgi:hypothetical protein
MENLPKNSKQWWSLNKRLLNRQASPSLFPPIKNANDVWCRTLETKADAFAVCWTARCKLPPEVFEHFFCQVADGMSGWFPIRSRDVKKTLLKLRDDQATGPDGLSAKFLKRIATVLSLPLAILTRRIFSEGQWPARWRVHHLVPLFKKGSVYKPGQYRGIHLTSIMSKTVERVIGEPLTRFLQQQRYGDAQWAFRKMSSARDLVTVYVAQWVLLICQGRKIGLYLSDISGAFDKVSRCLLIGKLSQIGLPSTFLDFLNSYLLSREGFVRVEGALSEAMLLINMVFQGTVLGPSLWNAFFGDVATCVPQGEQQIKLFADDLTVMTHAPQLMNDQLIFDELREVQSRTHEWGRRNQVEFDSFFASSIPHSGLVKMSNYLVPCSIVPFPCSHVLTGSSAKSGLR